MVGVTQTDRRVIWDGYGTFADQVAPADSGAGVKPNAKPNAKPAGNGPGRCVMTDMSSLEGEHDLDEKPKRKKGVGAGGGGVGWMLELVKRSVEEGNMVKSLGAGEVDSRTLRLLIPLVCSRDSSSCADVGTRRDADTQNVERRGGGGAGDGYGSAVVERGLSVWDEVGGFLYLYNSSETVTQMSFDLDESAQVS